MAAERIEIDTESIGFRAAVVMKRTALALLAFRTALDLSVRLEREQKARYWRAFDAAVTEEASRG